ncbi:hypothetical protein DBA29_06375 [Xenophilus aerolatus]|nr:hypothetical protein [Xenophilus aerolatus]
MLLERLIYASRKAPDVDVPALVVQAARCNEAAGITGALATLEDDFFQYLEGTTAALDALLLKLLADPRHSDLKVLERRAIPRRMFGDWRMAHLQWNADTEAIFRSFSPDSRRDLRDIDPSTCAAMFRAWLALLEGGGPTLKDMNLR